MSEFNFVSKDNNGSTIKGCEFANSKEELVTKLTRRNLIILSIEEVSEKKPLGKLLRSSFLGSKRIGTFDLMVFCKQLSSMTKGGVPLVAAIDNIADETKNISFKQTLGEVSKSIREGNSFSESLKKFPYSFSPLFIANVEAGEKVGALDQILERLSSYLVARDRINKKIITAAVYPSFIAVFFIFVMSFMTLFLIPKFKLIYADFGAKLPTLTLSLFAISDFVIQNIYITVSLLIILICSLILFLRSEKGKFMFDKTLLKIPLLGNVFMKATVSKLSRTLSTLLSQGVSVTESLDLAGTTSGNKVIENASLKASKLITDGEIIPEALRKVKIFPGLMIQMAITGVESGNLPELLDRTADFYEDQVDTFITFSISIMEPLLIVLLGGIFVVVVVALYLPIFKLGGLMAGPGF